MSANADLITVETYAHKGKQMKTSFFHIWAKMYVFSNLRGPGRGGGGGIQ